MHEHELDRQRELMEGDNMKGMDDDEEEDGASDLLVACDAELDPADGGLWDGRASSCRIVALHFQWRLACPRISRQDGV